MEITPALICVCHLVLLCRSGEGPGVLVGGRRLDIDIALTQDDARAMAAGKNQKAGASKDKRNLYLVRQLASCTCIIFGVTGKRVILLRHAHAGYSVSVHHKVMHPGQYYEFSYFNRPRRVP